MPPDRPPGHLPGWLVPAALIALALGVRVWALRFEPWVTIDGTDYIRFAEALVRGRAFPSIFPPGYPALVAISRLAIEDRVVAASTVSLIAGSLLPWPAWWLARRALGARWAVVPALIVALHPALIESSTLTLSDSAYLLALYGALALAAKERPLSAGLATGAAFAIRPEALLPAAVLLLRELRGVLPRGRSATALFGPAVSPAPPSTTASGAARPGGRRAFPRRLALYVAGFLILAAPCWLYFRTTLGVWTLTPKVAAAVRTPGRTWVEDEPRLAPAATSERYDLVERLARSGPDALRRYPRNALAFGGGLLHLWPAPWLALSLIGLAFRRGIETIPLLHILLLPLLALGMQERFLLGGVPALAIVATVPLARWPLPAVRGALAVVGIGGAVWCGINLWPRLRLPFEGYAEAHKEAGRWLSGVAEPGAVVMDRKPHVAFYADRPYRVMPHEPYETLIDAAVKQGVRYLVLDEKVIQIFRPQLLPLVYEPGAREREGRLEMVYAGGHFKGYGIVIFRVLRPGESKSGRPPEFAVRWLRRGGTGPSRFP